MVVTNSQDAASPATQTHLHPDLLSWATQGIDKEEVLEEFHQTQDTGGLELADFIEDIEQEAMPRERTSS